MKNIIMSIYLLILSIQDVWQRKVSLYLLLLAITGGGIYTLLQQRGWWIILDLLPGAALCLIAIVSPKSLGIGDGMVGAIYGLFCGGYRALLCLMLAFILAAVVGVVGCIGKSRRKMILPFIPFVLVVHMVMQL